MANNTNNYAEEAANVIENTIAQIKNDYESFLDYLVKNGQYQFYNKQSAFVQRMMFFDGFGDYKKYRNAIKSFIFDVSYPYQRSYSEQDAERAEAIEETIKDNYHIFLCGYVNETAMMIKEMVTFKKKILEENPILTGELPWYVRENLIDTILRNYPTYQSAKKSVDKYINRIVATVITMQKKNSERAHC